MGLSVSGLYQFPSVSAVLVYAHTRHIPLHSHILPLKMYGTMLAVFISVLVYWFYSPPLLAPYLYAQLCSQINCQARRHFPLGEVPFFSHKKRRKMISQAYEEIEIRTFPTVHAGPMCSRGVICIFAAESCRTLRSNMICL